MATFNHNGYQCQELRGQGGMSARMLICKKNGACYYFYTPSVAKPPHDVAFYKSVAKHMIYQVENGRKEFNERKQIERWTAQYGDWVWLQNQARINSLIENDFKK